MNLVECKVSIPPVLVVIGSASSIVALALSVEMTLLMRALKI